MTERRWQVLSAAAALFAARDFHDVGMRDIGQSLGLNPASLYHHFKSKDRALLEICLVGHARTLADLVTALNEADSFVDRVGRLFRLHVISLKDFGDFLQVYITQREQVPEAMAEPLRLGWTVYRTRLSQLLEDGVRSREVSPDVDLRHASWMLIAVFRILNELHQRGRAAELEAFARSGADLFIDGMRGASAKTMDM